MPTSELPVELQRLGRDHSLSLHGDRDTPTYYFSTDPDLPIQGPRLPVPARLNQSGSGATSRSSEDTITHIPIDPITAIPNLDLAPENQPLNPPPRIREDLKLFSTRIWRPTKVVIELASLAGIVLTVWQYIPAIHNNNPHADWNEFELQFRQDCDTRLAEMNTTDPAYKIFRNLCTPTIDPPIPISGLPQQSSKILTMQRRPGPSFPGIISNTSKAELEEWWTWHDPDFQNFPLTPSWCSGSGSRTCYSWYCVVPGGDLRKSFDFKGGVVQIADQFEVADYTSVPSGVHSFCAEEVAHLCKISGVCQLSFWTSSDMFLHSAAEANLDHTERNEL